MPSKSASQHRFMAMSQDPKGRAKLEAEGVKVPPVSVAQEFIRADKGRKLPKKAKPKKHKKPAAKPATPFRGLGR